MPLEQTLNGIQFIASETLGLDLQLRSQQTGLGLTPLPKALRFYAPQTGLTLPTRQEVEQERDAAQQERDAAQQRVQQLAERLRAMGVDPDEVGE